MNEMVGDKTNNKNQLSVVSLKNDIDKLTIFFIKRIIENFDKLNLRSYTRRAGTCNRSLQAYMRGLREFLILSNNYLTGNIAFLLLPKLLFKDLSILNDFCEWGFKSAIGEVHLTNCNIKEDIEKYFRVIKINFVSYCKILLKEFDLMKFYRQCTKINNIKLDDNLFYYKLKPNTLQKVEKINNLLKNIYYVLEYHNRILSTLYYDSVYSELTLAVKNLSPVLYHVAFYYRAKLVKLLLKQYKEVMRNDELKKNINVKLFTHFSIILIFMCLNTAILTVRRLTYYYSFGSHFNKHKNVEDFEKILNKTVEILNEFYSVIFKGKEEKDMSLLIATCTKYPYIDREIYDDLRVDIYTYTIEIWQESYSHFMSILDYSSNVVSSKEYLQADRIWSTIEKIKSTASLINEKFDVMVKASSRW